MKKHILLGTALSSLLMLGACDYNEDNFPGYDELATITNVQSDTLDLTAADYKKIAGLKANEELALSKDPEGETYVTALKQLEKIAFYGNHYSAGVFACLFGRCLSLCYR